MFPVGFIKMLVIACLAGSFLSIPANADDGKEKQNREELETRLKKLELQARIGKHVDFVSRGQFTLFGIDLPTVSPTQKEIEREEEEPKSN